MTDRKADHRSRLALAAPENQPESMRRILAIWLRNFSIDLSYKTLKSDDKNILSLYYIEAGRNCLLAVNPQAQSLGLVPGQPLADARSLYPALIARPADPVADRRALETLADWCGRYTPWVGIDPSAGPGEAGLFLDVTGCTHLWGDEARFLDRIEAHFARLGLEIRLGLADSPGSAWAWSRFRPAGSSAILETGMTGGALSPLPIEALRLPAATAGILNRLGLRTIADLVRLPRPALAARFDEELLRRLDQALGNAPEPIAPRRLPAIRAVEQEFAEPLMVPEALGAVLARLLPRLCRQLEADGLGARRLAYTLYRIDGSTASAMIGTSRPVRDPAHLAKLFAPRLETLDPDPGIEALRLEAVEAAAFVSDQAGLMAGVTDPARGRGDLAALIDTLANRLGADRVGYLAPQALHLPERQTRFVSALAAAAPDWSTWPDATAPAPLRLFAAPEGVEIEEAGVAPETPPRAFVWRRRLHRAVRAQGPDRRLGAWWQGEQVGRDYWAIEDESGRRLWLCRDLATGRWAVHGLLAPAPLAPVNLTAP